ncbi:pyridoxal phosphate-dependent transferase [Cyathus striatus]|nr:pyridoxal phosphate-dependent transferase [Cyathus striatus]
MTMVPSFFSSLLRSSSVTRFSPPLRRKTMATSQDLSEIIDQVKIDIISKTHALENANKRKEIARTFILPTEEMYTYAITSTLGDDVYFEPSTMAALFMSSGTASNQIALRTHLRQPPYGIVCDVRAHIYKYEAGGAAFHSGAHVHHLTLQEVKDNVTTGTDVHFAPTEVIALENTLNGTIMPQDEIIAISEYAHSLGIKMHLDGARIWHVAAETATPIKTCLGAPVGSCLVGTKEFISKARWIRKLFGGGMRQTGILAASAAYALSHNFALLPKLETGLEDIGANILNFYDPSPLGITYDEIAERASALPEPLVLGGSRLVVHIQTSETAIDDLLNEKKKSGFVRPENGVNRAFADVYVRRAAKTTQ